MRIFVTGGAGFIGTHLCKKLTSLHTVTVYDNFSNSNKESFPAMENVTLIVGDILDNSKLFDSMKNHDVVIHLAAKTDVIDSIHNPDDTFQTNVHGTFNVIKACELNKNKLIFFSSREVYGKTLDVESKENDLLLPTNIYGITKMLGELLVKNSGKNNNLNYIILRLTNVYGPGGNEKGPNKIIKNAVEDKKIEIFGGKQSINFIYIDDVVNLISTIIDKNHISKEIFNLGSKNNLTVNEFSKLVEQCLDFNIIIKHKPKLNVENSIFKPDLKKSEKLLGFTSKTKINDGLKKTINWYVKQKKMK